MKLIKLHDLSLCLLLQLFNNFIQVLTSVKYFFSNRNRELNNSGGGSNTVR